MEGFVYGFSSPYPSGITAWCINTRRSLEYAPQKFPFSGLLHQYSVFLHCNIRYARALHTKLSCISHAKPRPNHHYAMHNAEQLRFWGPLPQVSEFFGKWQNGQLQGIKTNGILCTFQSFKSMLLHWLVWKLMNRSDGPHHSQNNCALTAVSCLLPERWPTWQYQTQFNSSDISSTCTGHTSKHTTHSWRDWKALWNP